MSAFDAPRIIAALAAMALAGPPILAEPPPEPAPASEEPPSFSLEVTAPAPVNQLEPVNCSAHPPARGPDARPNPSGALTVQVVLRRDRVKLVTVSETDPGLEWLAPCFERELLEAEWPWRRGTYEVELEVSPTPTEE